MEEFLEKENADKIVAWTARPIPEWAVAFRPTVFLDLGCGLGAVTTAVLTRLAQWGCLGQLRRVVLVDRDAELHADGASGLKQFLESRVGRTLNSLGLGHVDVQAYVVELRVTAAADGTTDIEPLADICPKADIILASHVTYYFGDGSGSEFVDGLVRYRLSDGGRLWVNIRDLNSAVYLKRRATLSALGVPDPQPLDYSEHFASGVLQALPHLALVDRAGVAVDVRPGADRRVAALLMMWRADVEPHDESSRRLVEAAAEVSSGDEPLYSETQFIVAPQRRRFA